MDVASRHSFRGRAVRGIVATGAIAGVLDLGQALALFGWNTPFATAAGLLGRQALRGGAGTWMLGVGLHFGIAVSSAAVYYAASRRLPFLVEHPLISGLYFGISVELVMNLIVLPLSALHSRGPYKLSNLLLGFGVHMLTVGLPIAFGTRYFVLRPNRSTSL